MPARLRDRCVAPGCHQGVAVGTTVCDDHVHGRIAWYQKRTSRRRGRPQAKPVTLGKHVPPHVAARYRPLSVTSRMLDHWRRLGFLGRVGGGTGSRYPWDDPKIDAQIRWLAGLHSAGHAELTDEDARAGFGLRAMRTEFAVKLNGHWRPATADEIGWLCTHTEPFTAARVPALALASSADSEASPRPAVDGASGGGGSSSSHSTTEAAPAAPTQNTAGEPNTPRRRNVPAATGTDGV